MPPVLHSLLISACHVLHCLGLIPNSKLQRDYVDGLLTTHLQLKVQFKWLSDQGGTNRWLVVKKIRERWWIHVAVESAGINGGLRWLLWWLHGSPVTCGSWRWLVVVMCHMWWCNRDWTSRWLGAGWLNELDELSDTNLEQNELSYIEVVMDRARKEESRPKPDDRSELSFSVKKETKIHSPCLEVQSQDHKPTGWRKLFSVCLPEPGSKQFKNQVKVPANLFNYSVSKTT